MFPPCRRDSTGDRHESIPRHPSPGRPRRLRCRRAPAAQWTAIILGWNVLNCVELFWRVWLRYKLALSDDRCRLLKDFRVVETEHEWSTSSTPTSSLFSSASDMMDDGFSPSHPCQPLRVPELRQRDRREDFASVLGKSTDPKIWCPNPGAPLFPTCQVRVSRF